MNATALNAEDLLEALADLPETDFQRLVCRAAARRHPPKPCLGERESELLLEINEAAPEDWGAELARLRDLGRERALTVPEEKRLEEVVEKLENHSARRLARMIELAGLRGVDVNELAFSLGLNPVGHG